MCVNAYHLRACLGLFLGRELHAARHSSQHGKFLIAARNLKARVGLVVGVDILEDPVTVCSLNLHRKEDLPGDLEKIQDRRILPPNTFVDRANFLTNATTKARAGGVRTALLIGARWWVEPEDVLVNSLRDGDGFGRT